MNTRVISYRIKTLEHIRIFDRSPNYNQQQPHILEGIINPDIDKIVFLDIDGVLNRSASFFLQPMVKFQFGGPEWQDPAYQEYKANGKQNYFIEKVFLNRFIKLQQNVPNIKFVILSTWRKSLKYEELKTMLQPLKIVGSVSSEKRKIEGLVEWWTQMISATTFFNHSNVVVIDDNIIEHERKYEPYLNKYGFKLITESDSKDQILKKCLIITDEMTAITDKHITDIEQRFGTTVK